MRLNRRMFIKGIAAALAALVLALRAKGDKPKWGYTVVEIPDGVTNVSIWWDKGVVLTVFMDGKLITHNTRPRHEQARSESDELEYKVGANNE